MGDDQQALLVHQPVACAVLGVSVVDADLSVVLRPGREDLDREGAETAVTLEVPAVVPVAQLGDLPPVISPAGHVGLRVAGRVVFIIGNQRTVLVVEADIFRAVDDPAAYRNRIDPQHRVGDRDGQGDGLASDALPVDHVAAAGVREVVVGGAVGRVAPHPQHVVVAVGSHGRAYGVGVHGPFAVQQRGVEQAAPLLGRVVVLVVDHVSVTAAAVPVLEDQCAVRAVHKARVGHARFILAGHPVDLAERGDVVRTLGAEIDQRGGVHVAAQVDHTLAVDLHGDVVVSVPADFARQFLVLPLIFVQPAGGDGHHVGRVVIGDILVRFSGDERKADREVGHDAVNLQRAFLWLGGASRCGEQGGAGKYVDRFHRGNKIKMGWRFWMDRRPLLTYRGSERVWV